MIRRVKAHVSDSDFRSLIDRYTSSRTTYTLLVNTVNSNPNRGSRGRELFLQCCRPENPISSKDFKLEQAFSASGGCFVCIDARYLNRYVDYVQGTTERYYA